MSATAAGRVNMRVIIGNRQHFGFSPGELCSGRRAVTLRAMVTAARVIGDDCLGALLALWSSLLRAAHLNDSLNDGLNFPLCIYCLRFAVKFFESSRCCGEDGRKMCYPNRKRAFQFPATDWPFWVQAVR